MHVCSFYSAQFSVLSALPSKIIPVQTASHMSHPVCLKYLQQVTNPTLCRICFPVYPSLCLVSPIFSGEDTGPGNHPFMMSQKTIRFHKHRNQVDQKNKPGQVLALPSNTNLFVIWSPSKHTESPIFSAALCVLFANYKCKANLLGSGFKETIISDL